MHERLFTVISDRRPSVSGFFEVREGGRWLAILPESKVSQTLRYLETAGIVGRVARNQPKRSPTLTQREWMASILAARLPIAGPRSPAQHPAPKARWSKSMQEHGGNSQLRKRSDLRPRERPAAANPTT